jgi:predicted permease
MGTLFQDVRYGVRMLVKSPGFTAVAIITLALGIGINTAIFTVVNAVLLEPLPFRDPSRLVLIKEVLPKFSNRPMDVPAPDVLTYQAQNHSFEAVAGYRPDRYELSGGSGVPVSVLGVRSTAALMKVLGVNPQLGRNFTAAEDTSGQKVVLISYGLWQGRLGGDPHVLGRTLNLDRVPYTIVGVMPQWFEFPLSSTGEHARHSEIWVPMSFNKHELEDVGDNFDYRVIARLKSGVTIEQATDDVGRIARGILETFPPEMRGDLTLLGVALPLREQVVGGVRALLYLLLGAVGCVLLIACANVANLLLARTVRRGREIAIRLALGATATRVMLQLLAESVLLAVLGGVAGLLLAFWGTELLVRLIPAGIPLVHPISVSLPVLGFTAALAGVTGILFGLVPALAAARTDVNDALKESARSSGSLQHRRLRSIVVVAEVALAMALLAGAGLLLRSFDHVRRTNPGFDPQHLITASFRLPAVGTYRQVTGVYSDPTSVRNFYTTLLERLARLPGVASVSASTDLPLEMSWSHVFSIEGYTPPRGERLNIDSHSVVFGDYFRTLGIPLLRGRVFNDNDYRGKESIVIISESIAQRFLPKQDPIGKRLKWGPPQSDSPWLTIVGVVADVKQGRLDEATLPHTYTPYPAAPWLGNVELRTVGDPSLIATELRKTFAELDPQLAISDVRTMDQVIAESNGSRKATMFLLIVFAGSALLLAAVGIYGVIAHTVAQRTHEIGIRMTLGATRMDILHMVLRSGLLLGMLGTLVGGVAAVALSRVLKGMLFEVKPADPLTFAAVATLLVAVALLASYIPARRATKVDPMVALRYE